MRCVTTRAADARMRFTKITEEPACLPVSFRLDGTLYRGIPTAHFAPISQTRACTPERETVTRVFRAGTLELTLIASLYPEFGAYEWTLWFAPSGACNTGVISDLRALDDTFSGENPILRGILGDHENQYRPYRKLLRDGGAHFCSLNGRPTHIWFPYFNLEYGDGGAFLSLGWGGTWSAYFTPDCGGGVRVTMEGTQELHTFLKPGERIRTPLISILPYEGRDELAASNLWRRWYIACCMPRADAAGTPLAPFSTTALAGDTGLPNSDGSISERSFTWRPSMEKMLAEGIRPDVRWFDAGWYTDPAGNTVPEDWWGTVGTWELDPVKWPGDSFRESTDFARAHGMKTLVWFEPERVTHVAELAKNWGYNPAWSLPDLNWPASIGNNLGDPGCLQWTLGRIIAMLDKNGVELYREDNNFNAAPNWRALDARQGPDRSGITENLAVCGHYALWDGILAYLSAHNGGTYLDSCASGGGRNDMESMRRAVPYLRSDSDRTTTALRLSMTTSFNRWIPFCGSATVERKQELDAGGLRDLYIFRASMNCIFHLSAQYTQDPDTDFQLLRRGFEEWHSVKRFLMADFWPLTPWRSPRDTEHWTAWAYHDPREDAGVLLAFRMETAPERMLTVKLDMLEPTRHYDLTDADNGPLGVFTGAALAQGFTICRDRPRSSALIRFHAI